MKCVRRPVEYSNRAISKPRWLSSIRGSWIGRADVNPQQVDGDDVGDDVSDHW